MKLPSIRLPGFQLANIKLASIKLASIKRPSIALCADEVLTGRTWVYAKHRGDFLATSEIFTTNRRVVLTYPAVAVATLFIASLIFSSVGMSVILLGRLTIHSELPGQLFFGCGGAALYAYLLFKTPKIDQAFPLEIVVACAIQNESCAYRRCSGTIVFAAGAIWRLRTAGPFFSTSRLPAMLRKAGLVGTSAT